MIEKQVAKLERDKQRLKDEKQKLKNQVWKLTRERDVAYNVLRIISPFVETEGAAQYLSMMRKILDEHASRDDKEYTG